jgi:hypothetical protein
VTRSLRSETAAAERRRHVGIIIIIIVKLNNLAEISINISIDLYFILRKFIMAVKVLKEIWI